jgi:hypothetical protein
VPRQRALLRAAVYGRAFCGPSFPPTLLRDTCAKLRALNAVREPSIGRALTLAQLDALTMPSLISR